RTQQGPGSGIGLYTYVGRCGSSIVYIEVGRTGTRHGYAEAVNDDRRASIVPDIKRDTGKRVEEVARSTGAGRKQRRGRSDKRTVVRHRWQRPTGNRTTSARIETDDDICRTDDRRRFGVRYIDN